MMTALLAARNILGLGQFDTWKVNTDAEYHEGPDEECPRRERTSRAKAQSARREIQSYVAETQDLEAQLLLKTSSGPTPRRERSRRSCRSC